MIRQSDLCHICTSDKIDKIAYLDKFNHSLFQNKKIILCKKCGFGQIAPPIDSSSLSDFYENYYRSPDSVMHIDFKKTRLSREVIDYRSISQLLLGAQYMPSKSKYCFLDIGAGVGQSFFTAQNMLTDVRLFAVEASKVAKQFYIKNIDGIEVFSKISDIKEKIDIILMSHSLEHFNIKDMEKLFCDLYKVLAEDGIVIIEVPHVDLRNNEVINTRFNDTPHLSFFSVPSLENLIERFKFDICYINTVGQLQRKASSGDANLGRERYFKRYKNKKFLTATGLLKQSIKKVFITLGMYDFFYKVLVCWKNDNAFYSHFDFKYGGDRDGIRCVLRRKKQETQTDTFAP